jgi:energy-coupling factor transport system substrate-specific component
VVYFDLKCTSLWRIFWFSFLGMISMLVSALLTGGIGPWLGYQVFAAAWIGLLAGALPKSLRGGRELMMLIIYAIFASAAFGISHGSSVLALGLGI